MNVQPASSSVQDRRGPIMRQVELPADVRRALKEIVAALRDVPRDCIVDRAELFHWLRRMVRRVEGVERIQVPAVSQSQTRGPRSQLPLHTALSTHSVAKAVFPSKGSAKATVTRTIHTRKGRTVQVETRQLTLALDGTSARQGGQHG